MQIAGRDIGPGHPVYIIAEVSSNHGGSYERAAAHVIAAKKAGADAVKFQCYTPESMTIDHPDLVVPEGMPWAGQRLYDLYTRAAMPFEWHEPLQALAQETGIHCFASVFDASGVGLMDMVGAPALKVASFELGDVELLRAVAATGLPVIMSTGVAGVEEITSSLVALEHGGPRALLHCVSEYPATEAHMDLRRIAAMAEAFQVPVGLSDHCAKWGSTVLAVGAGACIVEKHITLDADDDTEDAGHSLTAAEFGKMVKHIRHADRIMGAGVIPATGEGAAGHGLRRSLYVVEDVAEGETLTEHNVRSIRPGGGLNPRHMGKVMGCRAMCNLKRGSALRFEDIN
jgi:N-acetylneuraminate synthase